MVSTKPKNIRKHEDRKKFFSQYRAITRDIRQVVMSIPEITAKPVRYKLKKFQELF